MLTMKTFDQWAVGVHLRHLVWRVVFLRAGYLPNHSWDDMHEALEGLASVHNQMLQALAAGRVPG